MNTIMSWGAYIKIQIVLVRGHYKIYCPVAAFDPPTQSVTCKGHICTENHITVGIKLNI